MKTKIMLFLFFCSLFTFPWPFCAQGNFSVPEGVYLRESSRFTSGRLEIFNVTADIFDFSLTAWNGGRCSHITGTARINGNQALFTNVLGDTVNFQFTPDTCQIKLTQCHTGNFPADLAGLYVSEKVKIPDYSKEIEEFYAGIFKGKQKSIFQKLVGDKYKEFAYTAQFHTTAYEENLDDYAARVYAFHVLSLYNLATSIIMVRDHDDAIWCAIRDTGTNKILYYTNGSPKKEMPKTIQKWCQRDGLAELPIIYMP